MPPMIPRERADYSAIVDRPPLKLPGNNRIVFWTIVNYEVWDIGKPMARQLLPAPTGVPLSGRCQAPSIGMVGVLIVTSSVRMRTASSQRKTSTPQLKNAFPPCGGRLGWGESISP